MVLYYGRARQRVGSVNTNQLGLKMSGCPSRVGRSPTNGRVISKRVNCMAGICNPLFIHGVKYVSQSLRNSPTFGFCRKRSSKCLANAGGVGRIVVPYYRAIQSGKKGCHKSLKK